MSPERLGLYVFDCDCCVSHRCLLYLSYRLNHIGKESWGRHIGVVDQLGEHAWGWNTKLEVKPLMQKVSSSTLSPPQYLLYYVTSSSSHAVSY